MALLGGDDRSSDLGNTGAQGNDRDSDGGFAHGEGLEGLQCSIDQPFGAEAEADDPADRAGDGADPMGLVLADRLCDLVAQQLADLDIPRGSLQVPDDVGDEKQHAENALGPADFEVTNHPGEERGDRDQDREVDAVDLA